jgi:hypothetical protein
MRNDYDNHKAALNLQFGSEREIDVDDRLEK